jgi:MYXO-CTERM domain-containing protein
LRAIGPRGLVDAVSRIAKVARIAGVWLRLAALAVLVPKLAAAAPEAGAPQSVDALQVELERDYAEASTGDCATACRALDSMRNATEKLCALDPGVRCANARQRLEAASAHVRTACPTCPEPLGETPAAGAASTNLPPQAQPTMTESYAAVAPRKGGCAGCAISSAAPNARLSLGLAGLGLLACWRRRRRSPPHRAPRSIATYRD